MSLRKQIGLNTSCKPLAYPPVGDPQRCEAQSKGRAPIPWVQRGRGRWGFRPRFHQLMGRIMILEGRREHGKTLWPWCNFHPTWGWPSELRLCALVYCTGAASRIPHRRAGRHKNPPACAHSLWVRNFCPQAIGCGAGWLNTRGGLRPHTVQVLLTTSPRSAHGDDAGLHWRSSAAAYARWAFCLSRRRIHSLSRLSMLPRKAPNCANTTARPADRPCSTQVVWFYTPTRKTIRRGPPPTRHQRPQGSCGGQS